MLINSISHAETIIDNILRSCPCNIYVDMEFMCYRQKYDICLVQIMHQHNIFLFDTIAIPLEQLIPIFTHDKITQIFFACKQDIISLLTNASIIPSNIIDLQIYAMLCKHYNGTPGYKASLHDFLGIEISKDCTRSNWRLRPLTDAQISYSINDVRYLETLHAKLYDILTERNYMDFAILECATFLESIQESMVNHSIGEPQRDRTELQHLIKLWLKIKSSELDISSHLCATNKWVDHILGQDDEFLENWRYTLLGSQITSFIRGKEYISFSCNSSTLSTHLPQN